ncbi:MAG TPA: hypothetical protein VG917_04800 [Patescibacteria group bacterium]|nr:hypothetical protein [Patescibacteria group bacterium]
MPKKRKKNKDNLAWLLAGAVVVFGIIFFVFTHSRPKTVMAPSSFQAPPSLFNNYEINLDGQKLSFTGGTYKSPDGQHTALIENQTSLASTRSAAILVDSPGGSGTFYYLIAASEQNGRATYAAPIPLGDRIKIGSLSIGNDNLITVVYYDRPVGAPMADEPNQEVVAKYAFQDDGNLILSSK